MNLNLSEVLNLARKWQKAATDCNGTMMSETRQWVIDFNGHVLVEGNGLTITNGKGCECRIALDSAMSFAYAHLMLNIDGAGMALQSLRSER
jgi:hypothetical protein